MTETVRRGRRRNTATTGSTVRSILTIIYCVTLLSDTLIPSSQRCRHFFCDGYETSSPSLRSSSAHAVRIEPKTWNYKNHVIGYDEAYLSGKDRTDNISGRSSNTDPILLLNGFGVGSFHQHRLIPELLGQLDSNGGKESEEAIVYGVDYLGQGRSWPVGCNDGNAESERGLRYCIDTWAEQIIDFIECVVLADGRDGASCEGRKVHLVGNSVGGHLSVILAAKRPDLIRTITLLNATPVWGGSLPGWSGHLPAPTIPRKIGRWLFDWIRDPLTIEKYLSAAYSTREAFDDDLIQKICACTQGEGGHAAFASIMWSPPSSSGISATTLTGQDPSVTPKKNDFAYKLSQVQCDVLLIFGREDPWCTPAFAKKMVQVLSKRGANSRNGALETNESVHRYIELSNVGHCPNHEAPQAVGKLVASWIQAGGDGNCRSREKLSLQEEIVKEPWGDVGIKEIGEDEMDVSIFDKIISSIVS